ncbi:site-specific integrase [Proteiniclasticum sp. BAD-10]|uniref:Site-specific integrase n=1 Tax=Proteiniclasticum sediminis TaxID=2804028 RepID=A0A941CRA7_9CLOT|nr:site-specific integrase [Proteiniclasticum sediminis]MBR0576797.1 site-specific integrase [Proteiniclasticum sediminis]
MAKKRTRANGDGTIFYNEAKKLYIVRKKIGRDPETGKLIFKEFSAKKREDAKDKMDEYMDQHPEYNPDADKRSLETYIRKFLYEIKKPAVSPKTLQRYESIYLTHIKESDSSKNFCPFLYSPMPEIITSQIREWYGSLRVSESTLKLINIIIKGSLTLALEDRIIQYNPAHAIRMKNEEPDEDDLTPVLAADEQQLLIRELNLNDPVHRLLYFILATGLRLGEALCLRWSDFKIINKEKHVVVKRSLTRIKNDGSGVYVDLEKEPKTKASKRSVPLPKKLVDQMSSWEHRSEDLVFPNPEHDGKTYIFNKTPARHLARLCRQAGITEVTVRGLRHTFATRHFEEGTPIKTVQKLLGHAKFETTMNIYTHVMPDIKIRDAKNIDKFL